MFALISKCIIRHYYEAFSKSCMYYRLFFHTLQLIAPLEENEVLVLENLQDLPWSLAKSFHYLCDSENPQISKAMYILVLRVDSNGHLQQFTDSDKLVVAERTMTAVWQDAPYSFRQALITRLTSYVDAVLLKSDDECLSKRSDESFIRVSP